MNASPQFDEARMLHPMTLVQRFLISIPPFILLLMPVVRSPDSADYINIATVVIYGLLALPLIFLRYYRFRYRITPKEIVIQSGVLNKQNRSIPIERIQNIEIEQSLLPRMMRTAKVKIETAGSAKTEGVLEYVGIETAHSIREVVRTYQLEQESASAEILTETDAEPGEEAALEEKPRPLFSMPIHRVFLVGMFRFSLLYIALAFSAFQQFMPDPDELESLFTRGPLQPLADFAMASPALLTALAVVGAAALSWITGILVSLNRYYGFKIWLDQNKLHKRHGLLTLSQGTIPIARVQTLILRANLMMRKFKWIALEVQTMGLESSQRGHQMAAPLARTVEALKIANHVLPMTLPDRFNPVSPLTIRRTFIRYTLLMTAIILPVAYFWRPAIWGLILLFLVPVYAIHHHRNHGYALVNDKLFVRRGVLKHYIWIIPIAKFQVLYNSSSIFQRRLGLSTVYVDTAGAGGWALPEIIDLPAEEATSLVEECYEKFKDESRVRSSGSGVQSRESEVQDRESDIEEFGPQTTSDP